MNTKTRYTKLSQIIFILTVLFLTAFPGTAHAQIKTLVSPFEGSETWGEYEVDFEQLALAEAGDMKKIFKVEGRLISHVYSKPESKSTFEVFRSYERELKAGGFEILSSSEGRGNARSLLWKLYGYDSANDLRKRKYENKVQDLISGYPSLLSQGNDYLAAKKEIQGKTIYVAIVLKNPSGLPKYKNIYLIDVLEVANMETGTVQITEELLRSKIEGEGKYIIYSIYFDTGKSEILPESKATLETISIYLKNNSGRQFYIVGHTDDTGTFSNNMNLSERRASAVVAALQTQYSISPNQIESKGVGPLAPVATNETDQGRKLNRRVELVLRLKN
jgi:outer membrane protein OmpA-like peptidoglycan-associated protein